MTLKLQLIAAIAEGERRRAATLAAKEQRILSALERKDEIIQHMLEFLPEKATHAIEFGYKTAFFNEFFLPHWVEEEREKVFEQVVPSFMSALESLGIPAKITQSAGPLVEVEVKDLYAFANYDKVNVIT